ncbi:ERCC4 domain-containing protein [Pacmanvirus S19]|nr:ERCC4 domain-containing protein [Pacmanvirus S19]
MAQKTACVLICDTRERNVYKHEHELSEINYEIKQITTGDYCVLTPTGNILAVIERKSLDDFAASLKDSRHLNKSKLNELRKQTGCRVIYIIEGPEFPKPNDCYGNIPYRYIESSIFHLVVRDNVTILRTKDTLHTAKLLANFVKSMDSLMKKVEEPEIVGAGEHMPLEMLADPNAQPVAREQIVEMLTKKHEKSDIDVVRELWSCFPGIAVESADDFIKNWTLAEVVSGKVQRTIIANFKMSNGRKISKRVVDSLTNVNKLLEVRLLSHIPGISHSTAVTITEHAPLGRLLSYNVECIGMIKIGKNKSSLGTKRAESILKYFNYKYIKPEVNIEPVPVDIDINDPELIAFLGI